MFDCGDQTEFLDVHLEFRVTSWRVMETSAEMSSVLNNKKQTKKTEPPAPFSRNHGLVTSANPQIASELQRKNSSTHGLEAS